MQNSQCAHNYSPPIFFAFLMYNTHFWCTVTLVCISVDGLGVDWGDSANEEIDVE